jgi:pimeloyl-ACP methyl ester carboxylesterase
MAISVAVLPSSASLAQSPQSKFADVNGTKLHYLVAGKGDPVVLLHGFAETSQADGRGAGSGHSEACRISQSLRISAEIVPTYVTTLRIVRANPYFS